jgi:hypothetical protein
MKIHPPLIAAIAPIVIPAALKIAAMQATVYSFLTIQIAGSI